MPAVITLSLPPSGILLDGMSAAEACKKLEDAGAAVVGLNCGMGPPTMLPLLKEIAKVCKVVIHWLLSWQLILTHLLVANLSSVDDLCKQFGPRTSPTVKQRKIIRGNTVYKSINSY